MDNIVIGTGENDKEAKAKMIRGGGGSGNEYISQDLVGGTRIFQGFLSESGASQEI